MALIRPATIGTEDDTMDVDLSNGQHVRLPDHETYYQLLTEASAGLIDAEEQYVLREAGILVAGCGAVGANVVESLVRAGCEWLTLVDPKACDIHHLGRMAIDLRSLDRNRAEVMAERAGDINPYAIIEPVPAGISDSNAADLLDDIDIVIDTLGIESNADLTARYHLHTAAHALNIPVICGFDVACAGWVLIYDYRDEKQEILDGALGDDDLDPNVAADQIEILTRMISLSTVPIEMIREAERMLNGQSDQLPRLGFSAQLTSSIISHSLLDIIFERPVRRMISVDLAGVSRPAGTTLKLAGKRLMELYGLRRHLRHRRRNGRVGVFTPLEDEAFKQLRPYMECRTYETGSVIIRQGDPADEFFVITDGRVHVEHEEHSELDGIDHVFEPSYTVIAELGPGDYFGEIALLNNTNRGASVVVTERCEVLVLSRGGFEIYLEESRHAAERVGHIALSRHKANEPLGA